MIRSLPIRAPWTPFGERELAAWLRDPLCLRMQAVLAAWEGTRYGSGQRCRGVAADCVGFALGAVDDLDGRPRAQDPLLPSDAALHDPDGARRAVAALRRLYAPARRLRPGEALEPFDLLVVGSAGGGPGHLMLVGPLPNTLWHSTRGPGVSRAGWALSTGGDVLHAAYRLQDRERWL